jgi:hypothetical protein
MLRPAFFAGDLEIVRISGVVLNLTAEAALLTKTTMPSPQRMG